MAKKKDDPSGIDWSREEKILSEQNNPQHKKESSFKIPSKTILISVGILALIVLVVFGLKSLSTTINATGDSIVDTQESEVSSGDYICPDGTLAANKEECDLLAAKADEVAQETPEEAEETVIEVESEKVEETVATTYDNTEVTLTNIHCEWKETFGKVTAIEYAVSNGESGKIQPSIAVFFNEDRVQFPKEYLLSGELSELSSGATKPFTLDILPEESFTSPSEQKEFGLYLVDENSKKMGKTSYLDFTMTESTCTD